MQEADDHRSDTPPVVGDAQTPREGVRETEASAREPIAVVGMSCRLSGVCRQIFKLLERPNRRTSRNLKISLQPLDAL